MIVRNEAHTLRACLESVAGMVTQIVVADTGSTDGTTAIAKEFGATVIDIPWDDHFANARNSALSALRTDWVLVLDADEELDRDARQRIPKLLEHPEAGGYLIPIRNYVPLASGHGWDRVTQPNDRVHPRAFQAPAYFVKENCRLFRRHPDIYFVGRIHERVEPRIAALGMRLQMADFCIHHFGQLDETQAQLERAAAYCKLMRLKVEEPPEDPMAWLQLGLHEYEYGSDDPMPCVERALALDAGATQAWLLKGKLLLDKGKLSEALIALNKVASGASLALGQHLRGDALHGLGRFREARAAYTLAAQLSGDDPVVASKLGYVEIRLGNIDLGLARLKRAAATAPHLPDVQERLMKAFVAVGRWTSAAQQADRWAAVEATPRAYLRAVSIHVYLKQNEEAREVLARGIELFPNSPDLRRAYAELGGFPASR